MRIPVLIIAVPSLVAVTLRILRLLLPPVRFGFVETGRAIRIAIVGLFRIPVRLERGRRWLLRRLGHLLAFIWASAALSTRWARCRRVARPITHLFGAISHLLFQPYRWLAARFGTRLPVQRVVGGTAQVLAALGENPPISPDMAALPLRTSYGEALDALGLSFVVSENRIDLVRQGRKELMSVLQHLEPAFERAIAAANRESTVLVSAGEGCIDAVQGLIIPACEKAMSALLGLDGDIRGAGRFALAQMLLHRTFLNPVSRRATSDWVAERLARDANKVFLAQIEPEMLRPFAVDQAIGPDDSAARSTLVMLATSVGPHVAWAAATTLDEILRHPDDIAALRGNEPKPDQHTWGSGRPRVIDGASPDERLADLLADGRVRLILEAMRHQPVTQGLIRDCPHAAHMLYGDGQDRLLHEGVTFIYSRTAEFDGKLRGPGHAHPLRFDPRRFAPATTGDAAVPMMSFGAGLHRCLGRDLALRMMVAIFDPLFIHTNVRRHPGAAGAMRHRVPNYSPLVGSGSWPFPTSMVVTYDSGVPA